MSAEFIEMDVERWTDTQRRMKVEEQRNLREEDKMYGRGNVFLFMYEDRWKKRKAFKI